MRSHYEKDIVILERNQRWVAKMIPALRQLSYEYRLKQRKLRTLETSRIRPDQMEVFELMHGFEDTDKSKFFKITDANITREHNLMISEEQCKVDIAKCSPQRVPDTWNRLPA